MSGPQYIPDADDLTRPLAGRQQAQDELLRLLNRSLEGYGRVVLISGEAGIGKTTLVERLSVQAGGAGVRAVTGHCYNLTAGQPYGPWIEIFQALASGPDGVRLPVLAGVTSSPSGPHSKEELFAQVSRDLSELTAAGPLVLVLEDVHWADYASLELLRHIGRQAGKLPLLVTVTFRDDEPGSDSALPRMLPDLVRESRAERLELRRLTMPDVEVFLAGLYGGETAPALARYLYERGDGNPFFMHELLRDIPGDQLASPEFNSGDESHMRGLPVPALVRQTIENRVQRLSEPTRALLGSAAVIGQEVPVFLWQGVTGASDDELAGAIEEAAACHILEESGEGGRVRFVHGLIQETLYRGQVELRRRSRHREIATFLASQPDPSPDLVAHHFDRAADARAVPWLIRAAEHAEKLYASPDAIRYVNRAIELAETFATPIPAEAYRIRAAGHEILGEIDSAKADYESLLAMAKDQGDLAAECQALIDLGLLWAGHDYHRSGEYLDRALAIARELDDELTYARCLNRVANWQANTGQFEPAIGGLEQALRVFEAHEDSEGIADTLDLLGSTHYLAGNYRASVASFDRSIEQSRRLSNRVRLASSLNNLSIIGGDFDVSFDAGMAASRSPETWTGYGEEAVQITREIGWKSGEAFSLAMLGSVVAVRGDLGRGLTLLEEAHDIARRLEHQQWLVATSLIIGSLWAELFDPSRTQFHLERARGLTQGLGSHLWLRLVDAALATFYAENGDISVGVRLLEEWSQGVETARSHAGRALRFATGRVNLAAGAADTALEAADSLIALEEVPGDVEGIPQVLKLKGDALQMLNRVDEADGAYASAARAAGILGYRTIHWRILRGWSITADHRGDIRHAAELRRAAQSLVRDIARTIADPEIRNRFHQRAHDLIQAAGHPADRPGRATAGLSQREFEVLALVAEGLTDAQVGERLFISPRTVARHLQSIYVKLDVNSRAAATAFAYKHHLIS